MVHSGYEASAVADQFGSLKGFAALVRGFFAKYPDAEAMRMLEEPVKPVHAQAGLVQLTMKTKSSDAEKVGA
jgi:hypothetical protein